ncbi:peptide MFS transporter [Pseudoalteromonas denitrificans]|uniref:Proton-dependent oligopeptide transporter, POT family n=1 Tax=Pseudoalteromonas denitrificans DSM 6059 TaxID=1123010 RepID=A0A1I1KZ90_9GAMM|nr:peptide MFS transporter [Pseudoalteromonas denitrificans]SFC66126.1 proton-dependent oligopeptide transporter, POT family [Pseudoalteromonas denitrificans DSM 6059]
MEQTTVTSENTQMSQDELFGHPKGLYVCFATELWERFSFYGMKYLLLLYVTKYHLFSDGEGLEVLGAYAGLVYALPVIGGMLADRYLGMRKAVLFGGILLCLGHLLMAVEGHQAVQYVAGTLLESDLTLNDGTVILAGTKLTQTVKIQDVAALNVFYFALALIVVGVGFLKPNISTIVGQLYAQDDPRRDSGFTIFYMGINLGSFMATIICVYLGETFGWGYGFGAAGIGMFFGLLTFIKGNKYLKGLAEPEFPEVLHEKIFGPLSREHLIYLISILSLSLFWLVIQHEPMVFAAQQFLLVVSGVGLITYAVLKGTKEEMQQMIVLMVLIFSTIVFWALFEQAAGSMTLFADRVVDRNIAGIEIAAGQFGSLNAGFIILLALPFAALWVKLDKYNLNPNIPVKFALGIIQAGLGFGVLVLGAQFPNEAGQISLWWLVLAYLIHTTGELCLSPVGLSAVTKLAIHRVVGLSMGVWFLATALSETVAMRLGKLAAIETNGSESINITDAVVTYTQLFEFLMWVGVGCGVLLLLISPILKRAMHGIR